jgi:hypothetical protein
VGSRWLVVLAVLVASAAFGADIWVGRLWCASGSCTNSTTVDDAGTFPILNPQSAAMHYAVQCNTDSCVAAGKDAGFTVGCANQGFNAAFGTPAVAIAGGLLFDIPLAPNLYGIGAIAADGGVVSCAVFRVASMAGN